MSESLCEVPVMSSQSTKCADLALGTPLPHTRFLYWGRSPHGKCDVPGIQSQTEKRVLGGFQLHIELTESFKHDT